MAALIDQPFETPETSPDITSTVWQEASRALARHFRAWQNQELTITCDENSLWPAKNQKAKSRTLSGLVDYVTSSGFGLRHQMRGTWGDAEGPWVRVFFAWTDLWHTHERVLVSGTMTEGSLTCEARDVVAEWLVTTQAQWPLRGPELVKSGNAGGADADAAELHHRLAELAD